MLRHWWSARAFRFGTALALALGNAACTATPPPPASSVAAADQGARVPAARYRSVMAVAGALRPAEPQPWQDLNRNVAPSAAKPKEQEP
jgi:hypothetical protein